jgi:hypothetical protein
LNKFHYLRVVFSIHEISGDRELESIHLVEVDGIEDCLFGTALFAKLSGFSQRLFWRLLLLLLLSQRIEGDILFVIILETSWNLTPVSLFMTI